MTNEDQPIITPDGWEDTYAEGQRALREIREKEGIDIFKWLRWPLDKYVEVVTRRNRPNPKSK
ncbi:MAG TPA: hypothetical protein VF189_06100 [Patescibacteria group bacterium]